jgi:hypothetical protein
MAADRHGVAAAASKYLSQALFRVEGFAALIEDYLGEIGAEPDLADIGHQRAGQQIEQRRLAGSVGTDDPDPVAAHDARLKIPYHRPTAIGFGSAQAAPETSET